MSRNFFDIFFKTKFETLNIIFESFNRFLFISLFYIVAIMGF